MTEKNIFTYKRFLSLNIPDFNLFLCENCNPLPPPPEKIHPLFPSNPPLKVEVQTNLPFLKIWLEAHPSPLQNRGWGGGGAHYAVEAQFAIKKEMYKAAEIQGSIYMCLQKVSKYVEVLILLN